LSRAIDPATGQAYTDAQMRLWAHIINRIWLCYVLPNVVVALAFGVLLGVGLDDLIEAIR